MRACLTPITISLSFATYPNEDYHMPPKHSTLGWIYFKQKPMTIVGG